MNLDYFMNHSTEYTCPICGKKFDTIGTAYWTYKRGAKYYCSWTCYRKDESDKEQCSWGMSGGSKPGRKKKKKKITNS